MKSELDVLRLTGGAALIGLQRVAKTSVLVLIGTKSGKHWLPAAISKQGGKQVTLDQAGITPDEILGFLEALAPFHGIFLSRCRLFLQSSEYAVITSSAIITR
jgi:hypothetical protein